MKFDVIIGKQVNASRDANVDAKLEVKYYKLLDRARLFRPRFISWVMRSRWLFGETQNMAEAWRVQFLQSRNFRYLVNYSDGKSLFPEVNLYGGVSHFLFDTTYGAKQGDLIRVEHFQPYKIEPEVTWLERLDL